MSVVAGVHYATMGWILPHVHDPDGHEVRFYTTTHHSEPPAEGTLRVDDPRGRAEAAEAAQAAGAAGGSAAPHSPG